MSCARSSPRSASSSIVTSAPATSRSTIVSQSRKRTSSSTAVPELQDVLDGDRLAGRRGELVERRDRVAVRAAGAARDEGERRVGRVDPFPVADRAQGLDELAHAGALEDERLTTRADGRDHLREVRRAEHEDEVGRRLLDELQERVPGLIRELVRLVDDVDLVLALGRAEHRSLADLAHLVDPALRCRVHLDHVERRPVGDRTSDARARIEVRRRPAFGIQRLRENPGHRGLARPARTGEEVRLPYLVVLERVPERPYDCLLADDLREVERPVFAVQRRHEAILADR